MCGSGIQHISTYSVVPFLINFVLNIAVLMHSGFSLLLLHIHVPALIFIAKSS